ncbi:DNA polymerase III subunit chi [Pseudomonas sp. phDV1]|nr:DNA polymerase III subunit chi [Pseudomonas sp. phDV1]AXO63910.1 DNA polymerase III subunit chi [Pseudomonas sp. phDV1]
MDTPKPPQKPAQLLHDLESIRELLGDNGSEPPLLIDSLDPDSIPVLSDIVSAPPGPPPPFHATPTPKPTPAPQPTPAPAPSVLRERIEPYLHDSARDLQHLNAELRAAAQLILQDVIDDFVPQIEAELKRRLEARLPRLLPPRK